MDPARRTGAGAAGAGMAAARRVGGAHLARKVIAGVRTEHAYVF